MKKKFNFWKRLKGADPNARKARRTTGVSAGVSPEALFALKAGALLLAVVGLGWGGREMFNRYYLKSQGLFAITSLRRNVTVNTGLFVSAETIYQLLAIKEGKNQFLLPIDQMRRTLMASYPIIKDLTISRQLPDKMTIDVTERTPVARLIPEGDGRVVDEEGTVFVRNAKKDAGLPLLKGADMLAQTKPGEKLHGMGMAAVQLVNCMRRSKVRLQLMELEVTKGEFMTLTLSEHRQAKFAWEGMGNDKVDSRQGLEEHFDQLELRIAGPAGAYFLLWDARVPGRITGAVPGLKR